MKDLLLRMEKPREFLIQRLVSTATQISSLVRRLRFSSVLSLMIQTGVHHMQAFLIAQISMRDSPLLMVRLEVFHTHKLTTTAPVTINLPR